MDGGLTGMPEDHPRAAHRTSSAVITLIDRAGVPLAHHDVVVRQRTHEFGFGCIGFDLIPLANGDRGSARLEDLAELWLGLFDTATLPFYWGDFEPRRGAPQTSRLLATARWFADRGISVKGHPLVWHSVAPDWLLGLPLDEVEVLLRGRVAREVADFRGLVDTWDAINEAVIMPVFANGANAITPLAAARGRLELVRLAVETARAANPDAVLHINDFDLSPAFEALIDAVLDAGIRIDGIGLQTHMHQGYRGEQRILEVVDRFARFGLPLHLTETTLVSGELMPPEIVDLNDYQPGSWPSTAEGEARQADELERHYRSLVGHPAVASITYWGLTDEGAWLGAPAGLVRADGTPKPGYERLAGLIRGEWWLSPTRLRTDAAGRIDVTGFRGDYVIDVGGESAQFALGPAAAMDVRLGTEGRGGR